MRKFQSTLPRRERHMFSFLVWDFERFNPRSREGSDEIPPPTRGNATLVSIHAPAKGATPATPNLRATRRGFNPRSHEGSDGATQGEFEQLRQFQSTLPRRERLCRIVTQYWDFDGFNPRSHEGSDIRGDADGQHRRVSIHAPTKGAT